MSRSAIAEQAPAPAPEAGLIGRLRGALTRAEWYRLAGMGGFILLLHLVGWGIVLTLASRHYPLGAAAFGVGTGLTAYTLGMRHAFDADHIAAIDNTTRKLMGEGERPLSVGFWFSLGHSSVVFGLALLLSLGVKALVGPVRNDGSRLHHYTGLIGTTLSGAFLYLIAAVNVAILWGILKVFRAMRRGAFDEAALEAHLANRGLLNRLLGRVTRAISRPWQMYPVGLLFGLGFDTASEVAFLVLASTSALAGLPWYAILSLPVLFAAGMSLLDTIDGSFMNFAYGWAFASPVRKVYYNLTITGLSVAVALIVGTVELLSLVAQQLNYTSGFWSWIGGMSLNTVGFFIVGLFVATWVVALAVWKYGRIEERWRHGGG
ncbi:HoxN/HupN/NixA family nickel/cobalt transporter [Actinocrinis puniceicyclus]|uniref:Nickel/cobalt efflux system n=1 Tax=Actinocrinis puniceicyclus TaxID=977794 RepID=A0A8J7WNA2_9ACTN|nr:HoxN/HupN/NixA family nickel/cobalt transporter [Actinocrinis puniceicyclus]MBS2963267.1 HoxN/HupN/NixA family nickel/cobalt transporter [Actinocrinis puniceicyclus]